MLQNHAKIATLSRGSLRFEDILSFASSLLPGYIPNVNTHENLKIEKR